MEESTGPNKAIIGSIIIILIVAAATGVIVWSSRDSGQQTVSDDTNQTAQESSSSDNSDSSASSVATSSTYKDGTYTATGNYQTPGGRESIDVKVTLASGVVSDASVTQKPISEEAHTYQAAFVSGYKSAVVGKKIDDVSLSRVAGSSLTPNGFNSALDTIKSQAKA